MLRQLVLINALHASALLDMVVFWLLCHDYTIANPCNSTTCFYVNLSTVLSPVCLPLIFIQHGYLLQAPLFFHSPSGLPFIVSGVPFLDHLKCITS